MRTKRTVILISILIMAFIFPVNGQQKKQPPQYRQEAAPVTVHQISDHVYELRGGAGANCAFVVGNSKVYVIDAKMTAGSAEDMLEAVKKTTDKPIEYLILTHSDGDHVNGMPGFPGNVDIVSHENTAGDIVKANEAGQIELPVPDITFLKQVNLSDGDLEIKLIYYGPAHTDGNIVVFVPAEKVAVIGDLFFKGMDPLIHKHKNGTSSGFAEVLQSIADLDADKYLSGHSEPVEKIEIEGLKNTILEKREKIGTMIREGKSLDEIKEAFGIPAGQSRWPSLVEIIYGEMKK